VTKRRKVVGPLHGARIEDYALSGDCETGALVSHTGSTGSACRPSRPGQHRRRRGLLERPTAKRCISIISSAPMVQPQRSARTLTRESDGPNGMGSRSSAL
jgi:hypothetical protein